MVKDQRKIQFVLAEHFDLSRVILGNRSSLCSSDKNSRDRVLARIPFWVRICMHLALELNVQGGLLLGLSNSRLLQRFSVVNKPSRQSPSKRWIFPFNKHDSLPAVFGVYLDDDVDRGRRIFVFFQS